MNISVPIENTMEFIEQTVISPLVSKCSIKVCYVGPDPNRNGTVITKEVAKEMGRQMPASPIVGFYNEETKDFEQHNRDIEIKNGKFRLIDTTKAYGFVPTDAKVWFQKFNDQGVEHEYLCTEGYIWTGAYPESKRIVEKGNNQSMELTKNAPGNWTNDVNSGKRIFIYNEALIEKLCILGEQFEPCFEGANITAFSLNRAEFEEFKTRMFSMITELQEAVNTYKGGSSEIMEEKNQVVEAIAIEKIASTDLDEYKKKPDEGEEENKQSDDKSGQEVQKNSEDNTEKQEESSDAEKKEEDEDKKKKYSLDEIPEYQELKAQYDELNSKYAALETEHNDLVAEKSALDDEIASLREFKLNTEKDQKQAMIDKFYMLSDEDKKDVIDNINTYSLDDIEAKLSVICVRNKLNLAEAEAEETSEQAQNLFSLEAAADSDTAPAWIKAVREKNKV